MGGVSLENLDRFSSAHSNVSPSLSIPETFSLSLSCFSLAFLLLFARARVCVVALVCSVSSQCVRLWTLERRFSFS